MKLYCLKLLCILVMVSCNNSTIAKEPQDKYNDEEVEYEKIDRLKLKADSALVFCKRKALNTDF